MLLLTSH